MPNLASICERYGGGGHAKVAAISLPPTELERARGVAAGDRQGVAGRDRADVTLRSINDQTSVAGLLLPTVALDTSKRLW